jgi:hypothetical protein
MRKAIVLTALTGCLLLAAVSNEAGIGHSPLPIFLNDFNNCAQGFHFEASGVDFGGVPFIVDPSINPRALTIGSQLFDCVSTPVNPGVIHVGARGSRLWLIAAADNNPPFPSSLWETTIRYADGTSRVADVQEVHTGLPGFIEFASWGYASRPDLAVWGTEATDGGSHGTAFVYQFFVELDSRREVAAVTILAPPTINHAYIYAATLESEPSIPDTDCDGVPDDLDNCPFIANPDQADADGDSVGDVCDDCAEADNAGQEDLDGDGLGDICDPFPNDADNLDACLGALDACEADLASCEDDLDDEGQDADGNEDE